MSQFEGRTDEFWQAGFVQNRGRGMQVYTPQTVVLLHIPMIGDTIHEVSAEVSQEMEARGLKHRPFVKRIPGSCLEKVHRAVGDRQLTGRQGALANMKNVVERL